MYVSNNQRDDRSYAGCPACVFWVPAGSAGEVGGRGHLGGDAFGGEVADAAGVGVAEGAVCLEGAGADFLADGFVGVAEGGAGEDPSVDLLDSEQAVVERRVHDVRVDGDVPEHIDGHVQAAVQQAQGREEDVLEQLEVAVVAVGHVAAQHGRLGPAGHDAVAVAADDFPDIWILLVGHDAGAGGEFGREGDESEIGAHVQAAVGGEFIEGKGNGTHGGGYCQFCPSAAHLGGDGIIAHAAEAQQAGGHLPVEGKGTAVAGRGPEWVLVRHPVRPVQHVHVL